MLRRSAGSHAIKLAGILRLDRVPVLLAVYFLVMLGFNFYYVAFPVHAAEGLHWSARAVGAYFSILSLSMVVVQGPILSRVSKKPRRYNLVRPREPHPRDELCPLPLQAGQRSLRGRHGPGPGKRSDVAVCGLHALEGSG